MRLPHALLLGLVVVLGACSSPSAPPTASARGAGSDVSPSPDGPPTVTPSDGGVAAPSPSVPPAAVATEAPVLDQAWATVELTDVATGRPFRLADFAGRTVFLEHMAIWCSKCLEQQRQALAAAETLGDEVTFVVVDIEPSEGAAALAEYADRHGFPFTYAIAPRAYSRAVADAFGELVLAPPTTPVWFIGRDGTVTQTEQGVKSADRLVELARAHGAS